MSKFLVWSSLVSQPPSSVKPMESIWDRDSTSRGSASEKGRFEDGLVWEYDDGCVVLGKILGVPKVETGT